MKFPAPSEDQGKIVWTAATALAVAVILVLVALVFVGVGWVAKQLSSVLLPLAVAGVIAYLLDPVVDYFQRRNIPRPWAIILVFFLALLFQVGMLTTVGWRLINEVGALREALPKYEENLTNKINGFLRDPPFKIDVSAVLKNIKVPEMLSGFFTQEAKEPSEDNKQGADVDQTLSDGSMTSSAPMTASESDTETDMTASFAFDGMLIGKAAAILGKIGQWSLDKLSQITSWFGLLVGFALVPVYVFYFLAEKKGIQNNWTDYLPIRESKMKAEIIFVLRSINDSLIVFFRSQVLVAMCVGILLMIGFSIINLRYSVLLGFMAGILGIVPYLGVMLSIVPALSISIIQHNNIVHPILTLCVFVFVQMLEGFVISPKIIGDRIGLHPLTVIISIMVGTTLLGGITGGVLAIPLTAALRTLMFRYVWRRREWTDSGKPLLDAEVTRASARRQEPPSS
ncbi:MAG: hypothetical protein M2R45_00017 [Verrucomicrobia subdivision 3 bacterium]|nr:hypothetical protein [Limisphaerales bacterium]MCS1412524.1 hypothetical protein [Limisphaerales bacterium]